MTKSLKNYKEIITTFCQNEKKDQWLGRWENKGCERGTGAKYDSS